MRTICVALMAFGLALSIGGCIMVIGVKELPQHKQVVEIDDELFVVDIKTERLRKLNLSTTIESENEKSIDASDSDEK
jgi:hypothetical protein